MNERFPGYFCMNGKFKTGFGQIRGIISPVSSRPYQQAVSRPQTSDDHSCP